jgi:hypothetical protein
VIPPCLHPDEEKPYLTKERAAELLREACPGANARRVSCGKCGRWSDWFPFGDLAETAPGWTKPGGEHGWARSSLCPDCAVPSC